MVKKIVAIMAFVIIVIIPVSFSEYVKHFWEIDGKFDYLGAAEKREASGDYEAAISIYDFMEQAGVSDHERSQERISSLRSEMSSSLYRAKKIGGGFITGNVDGGDSLAGCIMGDLCAWGDFRDVAKNSFNYAIGGEVDRINFLLSSIGLATTLAPHVDAGISICKTAARMMTGSMRKILLFTLEEATKLNKYEKINEITGSLGKIYNKVGGAVTVVIKYAKDSNEIMKIGAIVEKFGKAATTYILLGGEKAFKFMADNAAVLYKTSVKSGPKTLAFALEHPAVAARLIKSLKKIGIDHFSVTAMAVAGFLANVPTFYVFMFCFVLWAYLFRKLIYGYVSALFITLTGKLCCVKSEL